MPPREVAVTGLPAPLDDVACAAGTGAWFGLCADGSVVAFDTGWSARVVLRDAAVPEPGAEPWADHVLRPRLHAARSGRYVAVANDYGRYGRVVDAATGSVTMPLDGGGYHQETVPFSLAFVTHDGRDIVIHRSDWNRLDASDAATGALLTTREVPEPRAGEPPPEHYLDYFHGRLRVSPSGAYVLDDGWVWHPVGVPVAWRVDRWLAENVWESEDGSSNVMLADRAYWDAGMCWADDTTAVLTGADDDGEPMPGARLFDAATPLPEGRVSWAAERASFAGPAGELFSDGARLYSAHGDGLSVWDLATGERQDRLDGFRPTCHDRGRGVLVEPRPASVVVWAHG